MGTRRTVDRVPWDHGWESHRNVSYRRSSMYIGYQFNPCYLSMALQDFAVLRSTVPSSWFGVQWQVISKQPRGHSLSISNAPNAMMSQLQLKSVKSIEKIANGHWAAHPRKTSAIFANHPRCLRQVKQPANTDRTRLIIDLHYCHLPVNF